MKKILLLIGMLASGLAQGKPVNQYTNASGVNDTDELYVYELASPHDFYLTPLQLKNYVLTTVPGANITNGSITSAKLSFSLATVATSGSYLDLTNTPTIPAAQVNSDWKSISGVSQISNRPYTGTKSIPVDGSTSNISVTGLGLGFTPSYVFVTIRKSDANGLNIFATVRSNSITADGFTADLSSFIPTGDSDSYQLDYMIVP
jgi:hypothetical protein